MSKHKNIALGIFICAVASSFYIYDYILRVMPEAMTHSLMTTFHVHAAKLGILASLFFWGYAPMQIPVGILFDRFSARVLLSLSLFLASLAALGFAYADHYAMAGFFRFVMGLTTSFAFIGALIVGARWFKGHHFALYTGLVQFLGCMGAIIGIAPVAVLTLHYQWRTASVWIALLGFVLTLLMWLVVREPPKQKQAISTARRQQQRAYYREAFANPQTWWIALYGFAIWAPITIFAVLWGVPFLRDTYHFSVVTASAKISVIWLTIAFAGPLVGWLSKHFAHRTIPMISCSAIGCICSLLLIYFTHLSSAEIILLLIGFGIGAAGLVLPFGLIVDIQHPRASGVIIGFTNMAVILGGLVLQPLVGFILEHLGQHVPHKKMLLYSHHAYQMALLMIPICFLLALFTSFLIKETHATMKHRY
ncbi:MAG: MFS transporter [Coxiella sp. (in: Bacteria)]|nr:MAG: MFS transporter [Coxiella sp. (in: g-proteobacteria)]